MMIPYDIFNAAYVCMSSDASRFGFFQVILFTPEGNLVSTDGHLMYVSEAIPDLPAGPICIHGKPKKCLLVDIRLAEGIAVGLDKDNNEKWRVPVSASSDEFPDWKRVTWKNNPESKNLPLGWGLPVLKKLCSVFGSESAFKYESGGPFSPAKITGKHGTVWVMPCRI